MKQSNSRSFLSGVLVTLLAVALVTTAAATVIKQTRDLDYNDIKVTLDGKPVTLEDANGSPVEPFAINGTTYLPVRSVSSAFGMETTWDSATSTVALTSQKKPIEIIYADYSITPLTDSSGKKLECLSRNGTLYFPAAVLAKSGVTMELIGYDTADAKASVLLLNPPSALSETYPFTQIPRFDRIVGRNAFRLSFADEENHNMTFYQYYKPYFKDNTADTYTTLYHNLLETAGFTRYKTSTVDNLTMYHYKNDSTTIFVSFFADTKDNVCVLVTTSPENTSTKTSGSVASSSGSTYTPTPTSAPNIPANASKKPGRTVDQSTFDGKCPTCGIDCIIEYRVTDTVSSMYCINPKCTYFERPFQIEDK